MPVILHQTFTFAAQFFFILIFLTFFTFLIYFIFFLFSSNWATAMLTHLDYSVGAVVHALAQNDMLKNSIIVFSTDNGGPAEGFNLNAASNWPLRGVKNTLWEGGVRGAALLFSPMLTKKNRVSKQKMHISDWLPTVFSLFTEYNSTVITAALKIILSIHSYIMQPGARLSKFHTVHIFTVDICHLFGDKSQSQFLSH